MIRKFHTSNIIEPFAVQNGVLASTSVEIRTPDEEPCGCVAQDCERNLNVMASPTDTIERKNDITSFLFKSYMASDTFTMKLFKDDVEVQVLDAVANLGAYYGFGDLSNGIPEQDYYFGYVLAWLDVLVVHGTGNYKFKAEYTQFGSPVTYSSPTFYLTYYSDEQADGSIKLVTYQNGNIESSEFNYTGMNWYQQIRINGALYNKQSEFITDTYLTSNRTISQIQDSIKNTYTLEIQFVQDSVSKFIIENCLLANKFFVSDYNVANTSFYNNIPLAVEEISSSTELYYYNGRSHEILMTDRVDNIRKRNFGS